MQMMKLYLLILVRMNGKRRLEVDILLLFPVRMFHLALKLNSVKSANGISTLQQFLLRSLLTIHH